VDLSQKKKRERSTAGKGESSTASGKKKERWSTFRGPIKGPPVEEGGREVHLGWCRTSSPGSAPGRLWADLLF